MRQHDYRNVSHCFTYIPVKIDERKRNSILIDGAFFFSVCWQKVVSQALSIGHVHTVIFHTKETRTHRVLTPSLLYFYLNRCWLILSLCSVWGLKGMRLRSTFGSTFVKHRWNTAACFVLNGSTEEPYDIKFTSFMSAIRYPIYDNGGVAREQ